MSVAARQPTFDESLDAAAALLASAPDVSLACHVNPDPDALGSMLGLGLFLAVRGSTVRCSWGNDPLEVPHWAEVLGGGELIVEPRRFPERPDVMVALDTASPDRLGMLARNAARARRTVVLDHHRTNPGFGTIVALDPEASSTAEIVFRLTRRIGGVLPDAAAACLYAGLVADTGRFQYDATTPETLRVGAELRTHAFDHSRLSQALFESTPFPGLRVMSVALSRAQLLPDARLVWTYLTQADMETAGAAPSALDDLIDVLRTAREAEVACVLRQQRDGRFKVSLRSRGDADVGAIAQANGGGGHRLAAGYTSSAGVTETVRALVAALAAQA